MDRLANAEMVKMRGDEDVLRLEFRVGALQPGGDVGRLDVAGFRGDGSCEALSEGESGECFLGVGQG